MIRITQLVYALVICFTISSAEASFRGLTSITSSSTTTTSNTNIINHDNLRTTEPQIKNSNTISSSIPEEFQFTTPPTLTLSESIDGHDLPDWFATAASAIMIGIGILEVFFGYRLFRVTLFLLGMTAAGVPTFLISYDKIPDDNAVWIGLGLGVLAGLLGGILSFFFYKVGVFLCGAATGVVLSLVMNLTFLYKFGGGNIPFIVCSVVLGLGFGALGTYFMRITMILATTIIGSYSFIRGVGYFGGNYPSNEFTVAEEIEQGDTDAITWQVYAYFAGWLVLIIVGIIVQVKVTARKDNKNEKDEWEVAYDEAELTLDSITGKKNKKNKKKNKKNKKNAKKNKSSKQVTADALLHDYDQGGEFYEEDYDYDDGYDYDGGNDYSYEAEPTPTKKKTGGNSGGGILAMVGMKNKNKNNSNDNNNNDDFDGTYPSTNSSGKKNKSKLPASVQW